MMKQITIMDHTIQSIELKLRKWINLVMSSNTFVDLYVVAIKINNIDIMIIHSCITKDML